MTDIVSKKDAPDIDSSTKKNKYPFVYMELGDYCEVKPNKGESAEKLRSRVSANVAFIASNHDMKFTTRTLENGSVGVWRIDPNETGE